MTCMTCVCAVLLDNEPEVEHKYHGCVPPLVWLDHMRIRAAALRAVFADMNADTGARLKLVIGAAPFSIASGWNNTLSRLSVRVRFRN